MSGTIKFSSRIRELRIHLCQKSPTSNGARDFINTYYLPLKKTNPNCPILVRECLGIQPKLWVRFPHGVENVMSLSNKNPDEILKQLEILTKDTLAKITK